MGRKKRAYDYIDALQKIADSGLGGSPSPNQERAEELESMPTLEERIQNLFGLVNNNPKRIGKMLFFIMYDIESNKVRRYVVKYLERQGCMRIQKSIFLADLDTARFNEIKKDLAAVQAVYENEDSILVVPITTEYLRAMKIIGKNINIDVITHSKNTLFF